MRSSQNQGNSSSAVYGLILLLFIFCIMMMIHQSANASHMLGAELNYKHLSGQKYLLQYTLYRDCNGISAPSNVNVSLKSESNAYVSFHSLELDMTSGKELNKFCSSATSTCEGGTSLGVQAWKYKSEILLPYPANDWKFSVTDCCRNAGINTIVNPSSANIYLEAFLDNSSAPNNSAAFEQDPEIILFLNQEQVIHYGVSESDGDSIVYSLITPKTGMNQLVNFYGSYSETKPFGAEMNFNSTTGDIRITPTQVLTAVFSVIVNEYRNGIHIGSISRDMQMSVQASSNVIPTLSGINGENKTTIVACKGTDLNFDIFSNDLNTNQQLKVTWTSNLPDAHITQQSGLHPVTHVSWRSGNASLPKYTLTMHVQDDACPVNASQIYTYTISVSDLSVNIKSQNATCEGSEKGKIDALVSGGAKPYAFEWSDKGSSASLRNNLSEGQYSVSVKDANACELNISANIETEYKAPRVALSGSMSACIGKPFLIESGSENLQYMWSDQSTGNSLEVLNSGTYSVEVTNEHGCKAMGSVNVLFQTCSGSDGQSEARTTFNLYPNPVKDKLNIEMNNSNESIIALTIFDYHGKIIENQYIKGNNSHLYSLDLSQLSAGLYIIVLKTATENKSMKFCKY